MSEPAKLPFSNDGSFMEQFLKMQEAQKQPSDKEQQQEQPSAQEQQEQQGQQQQQQQEQPDGKPDANAQREGDGQAQAPPGSTAADAKCNDAEKQDAPAPQRDSASPADAQAAVANEPFIASSSFSGARPGYVFTTSAQGTGFYADSREALQPAKPRPVVLRSNNPIIKIQPRMPAAGAKRKAEEESKPKYLRELDRYKKMSCGADTKHDRPLVK